MTNCTDFDNAANALKIVFPFVLGKGSVVKTDVTFATHLSPSRVDRMQQVTKGLLFFLAKALFDFHSMRLSTCRHFICGNMDLFLYGFFQLMRYWTGPLSVSLFATTDTATQLLPAVRQIRSLSQGRVNLHVVGSNEVCAKKFFRCMGNEITFLFGRSCLCACVQTCAIDRIPTCRTKKKIVSKFGKETERKNFRE